MTIFVNIVLLIIGIALLVKGADFFVGGASSIAKKLGIPSLIIGLTLVSIGTSLPEASVSITSAIQDKSDLSFGNAIGSNIFNCFVAIGACSLVIPTRVSKDVLKYDIPIYFGVILLLTIFAFGTTPLVLDRLESSILSLIFIAYIVLAVIRGKKAIKMEINDPEEVQTNSKKKDKPLWLNIILVLVGLAGVVGGGTLTVNSASKLALEFGMSELLVALTIVSVGTSLPELVTSLVAAKKGEDDIAVGNAIGSSLCNIVFILGFSGVVRPIELKLESYVDIIFMTVSLVLPFLFAFKKLKINRIEGLLMILCYVAYMVYIVIRG